MLAIFAFVAVLLTVIFGVIGTIWEWRQREAEALERRAAHKVEPPINPNA